MKRLFLWNLMTIYLSVCILAGCGSRAYDDESGENERDTEISQMEDVLGRNSGKTQESEMNVPATETEGPIGLPTPQIDTWGITLSAKDVTPEGLTIVCTQSGGSPSGELDAGTYYVLERAEEGLWVAVEYAHPEKEIAWDAVAWVIPMNDTVEWKVDWEWLYGSLPAGHYRIGKEIMDFRASGNYDKAFYYAEFEIE